MNSSTPTSSISSSSTATTDQRLTDLEIKATYTEDLLEQLDAVIVRQQQQIDFLVSKVHALREQQKNTGDANGELSEKTSRDNLPPHF
jgi:SlyX protein